MKCATASWWARHESVDPWGSWSWSTTSAKLVQREFRAPCAWAPDSAADADLGGQRQGSPKVDGDFILELGPRGVQ